MLRWIHHPHSRAAHQSAKFVVMYRKLVAEAIGAIICSFISLYLSVEAF